MTTAKVLTADSILEQLMGQSFNLVVAEFWADWCLPCNMLSSVMDSLRARYRDRVEILRVDVDQDTVTPAKFGVVSIPTILVFENGKEVERCVGYHSLSEMESVLERHLS